MIKVVIREGLAHFKCPNCGRNTYSRQFEKRGEDYVISLNCDCGCFCGLCFSEDEVVEL